MVNVTNQDFIQMLRLQCNIELEFQYNELYLIR